MDLSSVGAGECFFSRIDYDLCDKTRSSVALYGCHIAKCQPLRNCEVNSGA